VKGTFIAPMLLLRTDALPEGAQWAYELKLDGYRAIGFKAKSQVHLRSRNDKDFAQRYPAVVRGLAKLPNDTVIDGELVAFDQEGRPSFSAMQNTGASRATVLYYIFDVMVLAGVDMMSIPLHARLKLLTYKVLPTLSEPVRFAGALDAPLADLIASVKAQGFEGLVAKRLDSKYEPGMRSGAWQKMRVNRSQEFVIGGYTLGNPFDALIFGYYDGNRLMYAARTRNGFTPRTRADLFKQFRGLGIDQCPFANLPEQHAGRWGVGLTRAKMAACRWLKPTLVGQFEFVEWTPDNHLRHSKFIALRDDKKVTDIGRE
jgi:bifunctional non-homologous end joining protein LigD